MSTGTIADSKLLDNDQAAAHIGVTPGTMATWRCVGRYGIRYVKVGRKVLYRQRDLDRWLESRTVTPADTAA